MLKHEYSCSFPPRFCRAGSASVPGCTAVCEGHVAASGSADVGGHAGDRASLVSRVHANGRAALKAAGRAGRKPKLAREQVATIEQALRAGPRVYGFSTDLWTLPRVATVIQRTFGVTYHPAHVWKILRGEGWSCQKPARRAKERDEAAIQRWRTERWPHIKKRPPRR